ncbi:MAG: hypothetical protein WCK18_07260 [Prolixibacteraceae bacterium]
MRTVFFAVTKVLLISFLALKSLNAQEAKSIIKSKYLIEEKFSPDNHEYQYVTHQTFTPNPDDGKTYSTVHSDDYLWIPPNCKRLRGVLVFAQNVPEQWLAGLPVIRAACQKTNMAILFGCRSQRLMSSVLGNKGEKTVYDRPKYQMIYLQQILDTLAVVSGYKELSTVPLLPLGESMSLLLVYDLTNFAPDRCMAGILIKDANVGNTKSPSVPILATKGTGDEWSQQQFDVQEHWKVQAIETAKLVQEMRANIPEWPGSLLIEAGSAHFSCTYPMAEYFAEYIKAAAKARLNPDGSDKLIPVDFNKGYVAGLVIPNCQPLKPKAYRDCTPEEKKLPWYFTKELAEAAYKESANTDWNAKSAVGAFADSNNSPLPFDQSGITKLEKPVYESDGATFKVSPIFLDSLPSDFKYGGGMAISHPDTKPFTGWLCGWLKPLGDDRFQVSLNRTYGYLGNFLLLSYPGGDGYRQTTSPLSFTVEPHKTGTPQIIAFDSIGTFSIKKKEIALHAKSSSGLPVQFFVKSGPAFIQGDKLIFTTIPVRSKLPIKVTVVAWQWGNMTVQTAPMVERNFYLTK